MLRNSLSYPILKFVFKLVLIFRRWVFEGFLKYSADDSAVPSALTAVVMVHVVLALFIYAAYTEDIPSKEKQA